MLKNLTSITIAIFLFLTASLPVSMAQDPTHNPDMLLKSNLTSIQIDGKTYLSFNMEHFEHWHTYWKNPGDAGLPTKFHWQLEDEKTPYQDIQELEWPTPHRFIEAGDILAYGYDKGVSFFFQIPPENLNKIENKKLTLKATWLVCKHICIPGQRTHTGVFKNGNFTFKESSYAISNLSQEIIKKRFEKIPRHIIAFPENLQIKLNRGPRDNTLTLYASWNHNDSLNDSNLLTPFPMEYLSFKKEEAKTHNNRLETRMLIDWDGMYATPEVPMPLDGKLQAPLKMKFIFTHPKTHEASIIEKEFHEFTPIIDSQKEAFFTAREQEGTSTNDSNNTNSLGLGLITTLFFAFLGGLILNVMPCVLPVISLKLFALTSHSGSSRKTIFKHNISYTLGVLFTFVLLAISIIALKATGESVGWGFQLQSPLFVSFMIVIIFILGLNMFGLFEFKTPGGKFIGNVQTKEGLVGDFLSGMFATVLSTPCSAPFLGTALTFAFSSNNFLIFVMFLTIGLGLAFPFILTSLFPKTISLLPRPGHWMEHVKKFLGIILFLTCLWLFDVFSALVSTSTLTLTFQTGLVLLFFAFFVRKNITQKKSWNALFFAIPCLLFITFVIEVNGDKSHHNNLGMLQDKLQGGLKWETWSHEQMNKYKESGDLVFIDFTAKWCLTCKVNEKLVLDTNAFKQFVNDNNMKLLLGDWTRRDQNITDFLGNNNLVGVPAYFVQKKNGELINLGETVTLSKIKKAIE